MMRARRIGAGVLPFLCALGCFAGVPILRGDQKAAPSSEAALARQILDAADVRGGLIVHLGCGDGRLTAALRINDRYVVHGLDAEAGNVEKARANILKAGLYGPVSVAHWSDPSRLPYADNLVNLLVAENPGTLPMEEVLRVLAPQGVALIGGKKTVKPRPADLDEWTHYLHDASGNPVAKDRAVGPPGRLQWIEGPLWQRHHEMNANPDALVSAGGRIFYINDVAPATVSGLPDQWMLIARDAFNGLLLWQRPVSDWGWKAWSTVETGGRFNIPLHVHRRLVASGDRLFATLGFNAPLVALDAATGGIVKTYDGTACTDEVLYLDGLLILSVNQEPQKPGRAGEAPPVKKQVIVLRAETGEVLWKQGAYAGISTKSDSFERITHLGLAAGGGRVCFIEEESIVALDLKGGRELWRAARPPKKTEQGHIPYKPANLCSLVVLPDIVLFSQAEEPYTRKTWDRGVKCLLMGIDASSGKVLWSQGCSKWGPGAEGDLFVIDGLVWTHAPDELAMIGIDLRSGQIKRTISTKEGFDEAHHHRCYRNKATEQYLLTGRRGIEVIDLKAERITTNHWVRGACRYGIMPCNGLIYVPPHPCQCYIDEKVNGFMAMAPAGKAAAQPSGPGYERGPAFGTAALPQPANDGPDGWSTYRHDARRSGATKAEVAHALKVQWQAALGGQPGACTVAAGRVFTVVPEQHRVCALDAKDGRPLWSCAAGARIDTPPTIWGELALFGSADGWVYAVRTSDGQLAWRFRAAPAERWMAAFGQLESAWPVHGSVLVMDGVAYAAAGRSTHLDGGIRVLALKAGTGELIRELKPLNAKPEGLEDILVADGSLVYMRNLAFSLKEDPGAKLEKARPSPQTPRAFSTGGLLDDSYFSRVGWSLGKGAGGDLLVFDDSRIYAFENKRAGGFGGWFKPDSGAYQLKAQVRGSGKGAWAVTLPVRVRAMAVAGGTLFVAGVPDTVGGAEDPWAAFEGRKGGVLQALATESGKTLTTLKLEAPPVWDGMAAAGNALFVSTTDGRIVCLKGE